MLRLYSLMWWLAMPLVLGRLWWRGRQEAGYRQHWNERLAVYRPRAANDEPHTIWLHAVSVGETRAAEPLVDALLKEYPRSRIVMTHMTPTGRATGKQLFGKHGARLAQAYLPYDTITMVRRFIKHFEPRICILMETEVWPTLIAECGMAGVPVVLANARLSERSLRKARRLGKLIADAARGITLVAAQTEADAERVRSLGVREVAVTGSIKFDVVVPAAALSTGAMLRAQVGGRPVLLCASTREGEEELILDAFRAALAAAAQPTAAAPGGAMPAAMASAMPAAMPPATLLLLVPRHPQRFDAVEQMAATRGLSVQRRSALAQPGAAVAAATQVLLGDSMGEMFAYFAACDVAFIGGSLQPLGGQNLIEAAALGKPVLIGEHTFNFALVTEQAVQAGGAARIASADDLMLQAAGLLRDDSARAAMGRSAQAFANQHRGATARTLALLPALLPPLD
ncbi:3-deoxy-D-manno-octulosonic acid transferase [Massilia sp. Root351]|jgi:3-deoxy-D-manno-octulosonic-acid transferase|uniref:lipid IV(A) 3-deoxy-D-manno-octulosonic acid transferase n=1 Tax=Massilia sp. Root351 TaxID=1736522 RepID=UPI00070AF576|nr:lipid IV(A) 3-deoxy-D-manno-octulosonic acid transferase [Massilia sp. Root351]KQV90987.1 3-deoxy-D-manno-octulosonic acid transferase [Massilia sp. Root351]